VKDFATHKLMVKKFNKTICFSTPHAGREFGSNKTLIVFCNRQYIIMKRVLLIGTYLVIKIKPMKLAI